MTIPDILRGIERREKGQRKQTRNRLRKNLELCNYRILDAQRVKEQSNEDYLAALADGRRKDAEAHEATYFREVTRIRRYRKLRDAQEVQLFNS